MMIMSILNNDFTRRVCKSTTSACLALGIAVASTGGTGWVHNGYAHAQKSETQLQEKLKKPCKERYLLKRKGTPIGQVTVDTQYLDASKQIVTTVESESVYTRGENEMSTGTLTRYIESDTHEPQSFHYVYNMGDETASAIEGSINDATLDVNWNSFAESSHQTAQVTEDQFAFAAGKGIESAFARHFNDTEGATFEYQTLSLTLKPELVPSIVTVGSKEVLFFDGERIEGREYIITNTAQTDANKTPVIEWRDKNGVLLKATYPQMQTEMTRVSTIAPDATGVYAQMRQISGGSYDAIASTSVTTNRIDFPRDTYSARYLVTQLNGSPLTSQVFSKTSRQKVNRNSDNKTIVDVAQTLPEDSSTSYPVIFDQEYLQSNAFIQAGDYQISKTAKDLVKNEDRAYYAAQFLRRWVHQNITEKNYANNFLSAKQVMETREGDCSEHAVLLAAMLRAVGMPSRIAVGLVYLPEEENSDTGKMVFHMWTEVYLGDPGAGEWYPLDATQASDQMDATHIKVMDTALTSSSDLQTISNKVLGLIGNLRVRVLSAFNTKKSVVATGSVQKSGFKTIPTDHPTFDLDSAKNRRSIRASIPTYNLGKAEMELASQDASLRFTDGLTMLSDGDYEDAMIWFKETSEHLKTGVEHKEFGKKLLAAELYNLAYSEFQLAVKKSPDTADEINQWLSHVFPSSKLSSADEEVYQAGIFAEKNYRLDEAWEAFDIVYQNNPDFEFTDYHMGNLAVMENKLGLAKQWYQSFLGKRPHDPRAHRALAKVAMANKEFAQADTYYNQAAMLSESQHLPEGVNQGSAALDKLDSLLARASETLDQDRKSPEGWIELGNVLLARKSPNAALDAFNNALRVSPRNNDAIIAKANLLLALGQFRDAKAMYDSKLSRYYNNFEGVKVKGLFEMRSRNYDKAVKTLTRAAELNGNDAQVYDYLAQTYLRMSDLSEGYGELVKADVYQQRAGEALLYATEISARKQDVPRFNQYVKQLADHQPVKAAELFNTVSQPTDTEVYLRTSGYVAYKAGDTSTGERQINAYLLKVPEDSEMLTVQGNIYASQGDIYRSMSQYQKALKSNEYYKPAIDAFTDLINTHELSVESPKKYWEMTPDEKDYMMVGFANMISDLKQKGIFYEKITPYLDSIDEVSVQRIYDAHVSDKILDAELDRWSAYYNDLKAIKPPKRFRRTHYYELRAKQAEYKILEAFDNVMSFVMTNGVNREQFITKMKQLEQAANAYNQANIVESMQNTENFGAEDLMGTLGMSPAEVGSTIREFQQKEQMFKNAFLDVEKREAEKKQNQTNEDALNSLTPEEIKRK